MRRIAAWRRRRRLRDGRPSGSRWRRPASGLSERGAVRAVRAEMRRRGVVMELGVVAEHGEEVLLQAHHQRMDPGVEQDVGALEAHLRASSGPGSPARGPGAEITAQGTPRRLAMWRSIWRAEHQLGLQLRDLRLDLEVVVA